ncbi:hypothetical protein CCACVL1_20268, partial [Corchorus capsularis]
MSDAINQLPPSSASESSNLTSQFK